MELIIVAQS